MLMTRNSSVVREFVKTENMVREFVNPRELLKLHFGLTYEHFRCYRRKCLGGFNGGSSGSFHIILLM